MKNTGILLLTAAMAVCLTLVSCASPKPEPRERSNRFDLDGDGFLTPEEYSASSLSEVVAFDALDSDHDGLLSWRELEFRAGAGSRGREPRSGKRPNGG